MLTPSLQELGDLLLRRQQTTTSDLIQLSNMLFFSFTPFPAISLNRKSEIQNLHGQSSSFSPLPRLQVNSAHHRSTRHGGGVRRRQVSYKGTWGGSGILYEGKQVPEEVHMVRVAVWVLLLILKDPGLLTVVWCILEEIQEGLRCFKCPSAGLMGPWMLKDPAVLEKFNASLERFKGGPWWVNKDVYEVFGQFYEFSFSLNKLCGSLRRFCGYCWIQGSQQEFDVPLKRFQSCFIRSYRSLTKFMGFTRQSYVRKSSRGPQRSRDLWGCLIHLQMFCWLRIVLLVNVEV